MYRVIKNGALKIEGEVLVLKKGADGTELEELLGLVKDKKVLKSLVDNGYIKDLKAEIAEAKAAKKEQEEKIAKLKAKQAAKKGGK